MATSGNPPPPQPSPPLPTTPLHYKSIECHFERVQREEEEEEREGMEVMGHRERRGGLVG